MPSRLLSLNDEPQESGAVVAVHLGDYRRQELWIRSGANIGNWYCLGGEFGRPKVAEDPRSMADKMVSREHWERPAGTIPQHPDWHDVCARGPVTLLVGADSDAYVQGWRAGRRDLWSQMEDVASEDPREVSA